MVFWAEFKDLRTIFKFAISDVCMWVYLKNRQYCMQLILMLAGVHMKIIFFFNIEMWFFLQQIKILFWKFLKTLSIRFHSAFPRPTKNTTLDKINFVCLKVVFYLMWGKRAHFERWNVFKQNALLQEPSAFVLDNTNESERAFHKYYITQQRYRLQCIFPNMEQNYQYWIIYAF